MSKWFPLPVNRCWCWLFRRVWPDPKRGPFSVPFLSLSNVNLYFSSHRKASLRASKGGFFGSWMSLNVTQYPGDSRGNPPLFSRLAQVQPAVKSLGFLYSLWIRMVDYGYMCMIHEHTAVFSITDPTARHLFLPPRCRVCSDEPLGENRFSAMLLWIILPPFFSENCTLR